MKLGQIISSVRKEKGYKQGVLAKELGITQTYLSQIERDKKEPNLSLLKKIANVLRIPLPIIFFFALEANDLPESKREIFNNIFPEAKDLIMSSLLN
ncbi:MAG: helix-turn-helix transcriptional regulator [Chlamydiia bacterium]|nr:helix-turn-helix transcriptional regulator [Chlamydiia bacterium]MCB9291494.1 helix-turn-helix transcriptional regulator [Lewinellaceae bacterium]